MKMQVRCTECRFTELGSLYLYSTKCHLLAKASLQQSLTGAYLLYHNHFCDELAKLVFPASITIVPEVLSVPAVCYLCLMCK